MNLSFIYLGLLAFRLLPDGLVAWLVASNGAIGLLGALIGLLLPVDTPRVLYTLDRSLHTGELLVTLHDLEKRERAHDFIPILKRRLHALNVQPRRVFRLNAGDAKRGGGILALLLINLVLVGFGPQVASLAGLPFGAVQERGQDVPVRSLEDTLLAEELRDQLEEVQKKLGKLGLQPPDGNSQDGHDQDPQDALIQLYQNLNQAQSRALGLTSNLQSTQSQGAPPSEQALQEQRERLAQIQQQLQQILEQLQQGQSGGENPPAMKDLQDALDQLPEDDPLRQQPERALAENRADLQQEALRQAQSQLDQRLEADQSLESLKEQLEAWTGQAPQQAEQSPAAADQAGGGQQGQDSDQQSTAPGEQPGDGGPSGPQAQQDPSQGNPDKDLEGVGEGSQPGVGTGEGRPQGAPPDWDPGYKEADIPSDMVEAESLEEWLSRGVPVESRQLPGQPARFRLSYDQVEALLDLRDLSPELRDVVRLYFLQIIGQLNQTP